MILSYFFQPYRNLFLRKKVKKSLVKYLKDFAWGLFPLGLILMSFIQTWKDYRVNDRTFSDILCNDHPVGIIFGLTGLILALMIYYGFGGKEDLIKIVYPQCGISLYSQVAIDEQADSDQAVFLPKSQMILAPEILISFNGGVKVIRYDEIKQIRIIKQNSNVVEAKEFGPFFNVVTVKTNNGYYIHMDRVGKEEEEFKDEIDMLYDRIRNVNQDFPPVEVVRNRI